MKLIFTKGTSPLSWLIRHALDEPVSHFAIVFDEKFVVHSNLYGVQLKWFSTFTKHSEVVYEIPYNLSLQKEEEIYQSIMNRFDEAPYDWTAFAYFTWRALLLKFLKKPLPMTNPYGTKNSFLCTELANCLPGSIYPKTEDLGITSPYALYKSVIAKKNIALTVKPS